LAWVALLNGSALSLFALSQSLSAPPTMVYWSISTRGTVFGPFIDRDHFPFYVCLCIGLSAGLLEGRHRTNAGSVLNDPQRLWVVAGIGLMAAACFFSLSRGAVLAMAGSSVIVMIMAWRLRTGVAAWSSVLALAGGIASLLALWLGTVPLESRLATL